MTKKSGIDLKTAGHDDLPASVGLVKEVREELLAEIKEARCEIRSQFSKVDARFEQNDAKMERVLAEVHRQGVINEEQRSENRIVLDGIKTVMQRQDRFEEEASEFRNIFRLFMTKSKEV